jgi:hypothetical protein
MKTARVFCLLIIGMLIVPGFAGNKNETPSSSPISAFSLDGNGSNSITSGGKARIQGGKLVAGHDGKSQGAFSFILTNKNYSSSIRNITFPVNINPSKIPQLTITAWVKAANCYKKMFILGNGTDKSTREIIIESHDDVYRWGINCGKDGILYGPPLVDEWVFLAVIYDSKNQAARLVVNDQVYASRATARDGEEKAFVGALNGAIDDIRIYDRILTQAEIEAISGKPITGNAEDLAIKNRYGYKERMKQEEENKVKVGDIFIVDTKEFSINDTTSLTNSIAVLTEGDTIKVIDKYKDGWFKIIYKGTLKGFTTRGTITKNAYPLGGSAFLHKLSYQFTHIFDFTKMRSWIIVVIFAIILFFVKKYFTRLDGYLLRLRKGGDEYADGGSKSGSSESRLNFLHKIYPVRSLQWYPLLPGVIFGATIFIGSFWDTYEMEWFFNEGFNILPIGYDRPVHWFLYGMCMVCILITISWVVESFVVGGPLVGILRIILLLILNFMSLLVTFFLLVLVAIIILVMVALWIFGNSVGSGSYKCPSCGRSFSASAGSSVSCPGCGASLST